MRVVDAISGILMAIVGVAALSLIVAPDSKFADVIKTSGNAFSAAVGTAKSYPTTTPQAVIVQ